MRYEKYLLSSFFDISTTKSVDKNKLNMSDNGQYDFIGRTSVNWGIQGHLDKLEFEPNPKDSFSLVQVGETIALWREKEWYASQNIFLLNPKFDCIKENFLYFQGAINKEMIRYGADYNSYPTMKSLAITYIILPTLDELDENSPYSDEGFVPDFDYMQERIEELEQERIEELVQERIEELEQYLVATGFNDYELTDEDIETLSLSGFGHYEERDSEDVVKIFKEFKINDLFESFNGDTDLQKSHINGFGYDVVSSGLENNGIIGKTDTKAKVFNADTITIDMFGNCFYRDEQYKMVTHARVFSLSPLFVGLNSVNGQYIVSQFKYLPTVYNYSNMCSWNKIKNDTLTLPIQTDADNNPIIDTERKYHPDGYIPDWDFMEKYIKAIEKIVIADVVRYKDEMIVKTKEVVS